MNNDHVILGVDPGTTVLGYGMIKVVNRQPVFLDMGVLTFKKEKDHFARINAIFNFITSVIKQYGVKEMAIESPFYGENIQSMLKLGRAQGAAITAALQCGIAVTEYAPRAVKLSVTGNGNASKEQVAGLLQHLLKYKNKPETLDATDGLAIALCHFYQGRKTVFSKGCRDWKEFLAKHPERIKTGR